MCSQYQTIQAISELPMNMNLRCEDKTYTASWDTHVYPYAKAPVITTVQQYHSIQLMSYSLVPSWSKEAKPRFSSYNARLDRPSSANSQELELIYNTPTWKLPFKQQRCLVPLTGFFESCRVGSHAGNIVKFASAEEGEILLAAGVWDRWLDRESGEVSLSFAILTDAPSSFILDIGHDRQPVFLSRENALRWLDIEDLPFAQAYDFLKCKQKPISYSVSKYKALAGFNQPDLFG